MVHKDYPPETLKYYKDTWGLNLTALSECKLYAPPAGPVKPVQCPEYTLEQCHPLTQDPLLPHTELCAQVNVETKEAAEVFTTNEVHVTAKPEAHNRLVLRTCREPPEPMIPRFKIKDVEEGEISCIHTIVGSNIPVESLSEEGVPDPGTLRIAGPAELSPEEHFVSLNSFAAAIAEQGILHMMLEATNPDVAEQKIGFNADMQRQFFQAIAKVSPSACNELGTRELLTYWEQVHDPSISEEERETLANWLLNHADLLVDTKWAACPEFLCTKDTFPIASDLFDASSPEEESLEDMPVAKNCLGVVEGSRDVDFILDVLLKHPQRRVREVLASSLPVIFPIHAVGSALLKTWGVTIDANVAKRRRVEYALAHDPDEEVARMLVTTLGSHTDPATWHALARRGLEADIQSALTQNLKQMPLHAIGAMLESPLLTPVKPATFMIQPRLRRDNIEAFLVKQGLTRGDALNALREYEQKHPPSKQA